MLPILCVVAVVVWVIDQTWSDARQIWREQLQRRRHAA